MDTSNPFYHDPGRWPHLTAEMPGTGGMLRAELADFVVDEVRREPPAGVGDHLHVRIQKQDWNTRAVIKLLRESLQLSEEAIGHAGLKDRRAVTTQWLSFPAAQAEALAGVTLPEGIAILETALHPTKLQEGDLAENRFSVRVRGAADQAERASELLAALAAKGVPNYYGPQRFGMTGDNAARGLAVLQRGFKPRGWLDKLLAQALQSWVFNDWLAERLTAGTFATVLTGDIAHKHETGGKFLVGEAAIEAPRAAAFEISATGPMLGRKYHEAAGEARAVEDAVLARLGLSRDLFRPLPGTRRPIRMALSEAAVEACDDGYWVRFALPAGGYATAVLREIMKTGEGEQGPDGAGF